MPERIENNRKKQTIEKTEKTLKILKIIKKL